MIGLAIRGEAMLHTFKSVPSPENQGNGLETQVLNIWLDAQVAKEDVTNGTLAMMGMDPVSIDIKYRGNSSFSDFDKPQYRISFKNEARTRNVERSMFGMNEASDWILYGPFLDRSLLRSKFFLDLSRDLLPWAPDSRYFELYLNDEYEGVYLAIEALQVDEQRIALHEKGLLSGETAYLVWRERIGQEENPIETYASINALTSYELSVDFPGPKRITQKQLDWISSDISQFEQALYGPDFRDDVLGYRTYIDMDSFVDYFLINELAMLSDAGYLSTPMYKDLKGRLTLSVWDFNNALNNYYKDKNVEAFYLTESNYFSQMIKDPIFVSLVLDRYSDLRKTSWDTTVLLNKLEELERSIHEAKERNFKRYGYTFERELLDRSVTGERRDPSSYEEAVEQVRSTLVNRLEFLDEHLRDLYAFTQ